MKQNNLKSKITSSKKTSSTKKADESLKDWFEIKDFPSSILNKKVWVPLRVVEKTSQGRYGNPGYRETFFGLGSVAIPLKDRALAEKLEWQDVGISHSHTGFFDENENTYKSADHFIHYPGDLTGLHLILEISGNGLEKSRWEPNQDLVATLGLIREGDVWLSLSEGYLDIIKLHKNEEGEPTRIEIRADHLMDYLCARGMGLYATFYMDRQGCFENDPKMGWTKKDTSQQRNNGRWEGREWPIHEGGHPFGEKMAVFHVARTDVDGSEDIPDLSSVPTDDNTKSDSWERGFVGKKLYKVMGEYWGTEWLDPSKLSKRVKGDKIPSSSYFIIDEKGLKVSGDDLIDSGKWLWFKPDVMMGLAHRRGGFIKWFTKDTGQVACLPHYGVHFGVNKLGLINVYAHDIGMLPDWQQQIWSGYNISPDGGVSAELLDSQVRAEPADTQSPEQFLEYGLKAVNYFAQQNLGVKLFNDHEALPEILAKTHRFRSLDQGGLFALAKDLARLTADSINKSGIQSVVTPPDANYGSLKSLEYLISSKVGIDEAGRIMMPLFKVYELRLGDAHLPSSEISDSLTILGIDQSQPFIKQGEQMIHKTVSSIYRIINILKNWND